MTLKRNCFLRTAEVKIPKCTRHNVTQKRSIQEVILNTIEKNVALHATAHALTIKSVGIELNFNEAWTLSSERYTRKDE